MKQIPEKDLLPSHYTKVNEPHFQGKGVHSVQELENIAEAYKELVHQLRIKQQNILEILGAEIVKETPVQPPLRIFWAKEQKCTHSCATNYDRRKSGYK